MDIEWTGSPNYNTGRNGKKITAIVDHITAGYMPGCLDWLKNPKSKVCNKPFTFKKKTHCEFTFGAKNDYFANVLTLENM